MHFIPHYKFSIFKHRTDFNEINFPNTEEHFQRTISLPLWPGMTDEMIKIVTDNVIELGIKYGKGN